MIKIKNKEFDKVNTKISFDNYFVTNNGKKRKGISPYISFNIDNIYIDIETIYDIKWLKNMKLNQEIDINKYITNILYEEENRCEQLYDIKYCLITKIKEDTFNIKLQCKENEIIIDENIIIGG